MFLTKQIRPVTINGIHGTDIHNAWLEVVHPVQVDTACPTVLIVGSAIRTATTDNSRSTFSSEEIGNLIAQNGYNIVSDGCQGIPHQVISAFKAHSPRQLAMDISILDQPGKTQSSSAYSPEGFPVAGDINLYTGAHFEVLSLLNTYCVDLIVIYGGGLGALMEGIVAVISDLPVICLHEDSTISSEMSFLFQRYLSIEKKLDIKTMHSLDALGKELGFFKKQFVAQGMRSRLELFLTKMEQPSIEKSRFVTIHVSNDMSSIDYVIGDCSARVLQPSLVIDPTSVLDAFNGRSDALEALYYWGRRYVYNDVEIFVDNNLLAEVACPSIDTFLCITCIAALYRDVTVGSAIDIGTGSGIIALWLLSSQIAGDVIANDVSSAAIRCAVENALSNNCAEKFDFRLESFSSLIQRSSPVELAVCNPPYVPLNVRGDAREYTGFEGLDLLFDVLDCVDRLLTQSGSLILVVSSVTWSDHKFRSKMEALVHCGNAIRLNSTLVPFKVVSVLSDTKRINDLTERGFLYSNKKNKTLTHVVEIWHITRLENQN